ncbi:MAG: hypothetical protein IPM48_03255 [Saprospiraceae bacterium]|nr:hypothetical protein [Saprospiraceae bacterium]
MKCLEIIQNLDGRTLGRLHKYLNSPYLCSDSSLSATLESARIYCQMNVKSLDKNLLYQLIFGHSVYDDTKLRLRMSRLFGHIKKFLSIERESSLEDRLVVLKLFRKKSMDKFYAEYYQETKEFIFQQKLRNEHHFEQEYQLRLEHYEFLASKKRQGEFNLKEISDSLETSYIIKKLRHCCRVAHVQSIYKMDTPFPFIEEIIRYIELEKLHEIPVLGFYYYNYLAILHPLEDHYFRKCLKIYNEHNAGFEEEERREVFINILNYCIRKINEGVDQYNETVFELYLRGLEHGFMLEQNKLSRFTYRNIAEIGINLKEFDWVDQFLDEYKHKLDKAWQSSFYQFEKGRVLSEKRNYKEALSYLSQLSFTDPLIELSVRLERIRIFYEMGEDELSQYHVDSMDQFLRRKNNFGYHSEYYKCFLKYTRKLLKINPNNQEQVKKLIHSLKAEPKITGKKWLLEKFASL